MLKIESPPNLYFINNIFCKPETDTKVTVIQKKIREKLLFMKYLKMQQKLKGQSVSSAFIIKKEYK